MLILYFNFCRCRWKEILYLKGIVNLDVQTGSDLFQDTDPDSVGSFTLNFTIINWLYYSWSWQVINMFRRISKLWQPSVCAEWRYSHQRQVLNPVVCPSVSLSLSFCLSVSPSVSLSFGLSEQRQVVTVCSTNMCMPGLSFSFYYLSRYFIQ